ncbi:GGDEF domain-containing protein [Thiomicrorhabdus aquaedulcis]|uniref:GGDEF domain-containing protein n=1 Tax=Thiomicrorhabdus aquaedulcis TaxID=2211106 RepID=UPI001E2BE696|nr:bifunctional diguanylate cyclase/phosphodiesterase [Thiomicrorhabdus aquaedulcis]
MCQPLQRVPSNDNMVNHLQSSVLGRELLSILTLKTLSPVYQPIVDLKNRNVFAFEALIRGPEQTALYSPLNLFHVAQEHGCLFEMDWLARQIAIEKYKQFGLNEYLFLNVTVNTLMQGAHQSGMTLECLGELGLSIEQVVIEITEMQPVEDFSLFVESINHYRQMGFKVAIDDLGGGYNGLRIWSEVKPDFVKVDKHFVSGLADDPDKRRFMETICALAKGLNTKIVAEGVEDEATLKVLEAMGVDYVQGFLFKKPQALPVTTLDYQWPSHQVCVPNLLEERAGRLLQPCLTYKPSGHVSEVAEFLLSEPHIDFVPVVENTKVVGIVWRRELMDLLARRFGRDLYHRKRIDAIMDRQPVVVEYDMSLVELSRLITDCQGRRRGDTFLITENGEFKGCGHFMDLLRVMTDLKMQSAQYANPLSGLPGNVPINKTIERYLFSKVPFAVIYLDVDHFKPYNDYYSFDQGDDIIRFVAKILLEIRVPDVEFLGHIGGDDFMIITPRVNEYSSICQSVLSAFRSRIASYYSPQDQINGGISAVGRDGKEEFFPIMSLSLGVLLVEPGLFSHQQKLASLATKAKKEAKALGGNTFAVIHSQVALG